jgi:hypothetical protein
MAGVGELVPEDSCPMSNRLISTSIGPHVDTTLGPVSLSSLNPPNAWVSNSYSVSASARGRVSLGEGTWWDSTTIPAGRDLDGMTIQLPITSSVQASSGRSAKVPSPTLYGMKVHRIIWEIMRAPPTGQLEDLTVEPDEVPVSLHRSMAGLVHSGFWFFETGASSAIHTPLSHGVTGISRTSEYVRGEKEYRRSELVLPSGTTGSIVVKIDRYWTAPFNVMLKFSAEYSTSNEIQLG